MSYPGAVHRRLFPILTSGVRPPQSHIRWLSHLISTLLFAMLLVPAGAFAAPKCDFAIDRASADDLLAACTVALNQNPNDSEAYFVRGMLYNKKGDLDRAIDDFTKSIDLGVKQIDASTASPEQKARVTDAFTARALAEIKKGEFDRALVDCRNGPGYLSLELFTGTNSKDALQAIVTAYDACGVASNLSKHYDDALLHFTKAIEYNNKTVDLYNMDAQLAKIDGRKAEVVAVMAEIFHIEERNLGFVLGLATAYKGKGDSARAAEEYRLVLKADPKNQQARDGLKELGR